MNLGIDSYVNKKIFPTTIDEINANRVAILHEHFPEAFSEGKIDFDKLHASLGVSYEVVKSANELPGTQQQ